MSEDIMNLNIGGVYQIVCLKNGRKYIGSSYNVDKRWSQHLNELRNKTHINKDLQKDFNQLGVTNFKIQILEEVKDENLLLEQEQYWRDLETSLYNKNEFSKKILLNLKQQKRFWNKVKIKNQENCWEWTGCKNKNGYGNLSVSNCGNRSNYLSSRVAYYLTNPNDNINMVVCHSCDNPACCNPSHLFLGSCRRNSEDMRDKGKNCRISWEIVNKLRAKYIKNVNIIRKELEKWFVDEFGIYMESRHLIVICKNIKWHDINYSPPNCKNSYELIRSHTVGTIKWNTIYLIAFGETKTLVEWFKDNRCLCENIKLLRNRIYCGWSHEKAITTPIKHKDVL